MVETWPAVYASLLQPVDPITSRKILRQEFFHRCKSQSCSIFISATPSIIGPSCSIIAQYLAWPGRQNSSLPTWVYCSQNPPLQVTERCDRGLTPLYISKLFHHYWCNSLSVWSKLQHNILIFGLVMVETWPAVYASLLQPVDPITSRKILRQEFFHRCKSQSCSIFISATPSNNWPKLQHYSPIFGLARPPKWLTTYMGLLQPDPSIAGYRAMWQGFNSSVRLKAFPPLLL